MARPAAEKPAEDERGQDQENEQHEAGVEIAELQSLHRLGGFERAHRASGHLPVDDVDRHDDMDEQKRDPSPPGAPRMSRRRTSGFVTIEHGKCGRHVVVGCDERGTRLRSRIHRWARTRVCPRELCISLQAMPHR